MSYEDQLHRCFLFRNTFKHYYSLIVDAEMEIKPVREILEPEGFGMPTLNVLIPNADNYATLLMQPQGDIEVNAAGVRNFDRDLATAQFSQFLDDAAETQADLVVTPEYAMPWEVLLNALRNGVKPSSGKLWVLGCESIKFSEFQSAKTEIAPHATILFEPLEVDGGRFLGPLAYVFLAPDIDANENDRLIILCQFKTNPMGDADHFEVNCLQRGSWVYQFGDYQGQDIKLVSLICSDAFVFLDTEAMAVYDRGLIIHIQLNQKPRQEQFRFYRDRLLRFNGDSTELICLNWACNVRLRSGGHELAWNNIAGSAWYLKPDTFDCRDETLCANHKRGLYYTWLDKLYVHALFFNYEPATYLLKTTKVAHVRVPAPLSRRRGPQLTRTNVWSAVTESWEEQDQVEDGFSSIVGETGDARISIEEISDRNPLIAERILALCSGKIGTRDDWYAVHQLDSCVIDATEIVFRLTFCQDSEQEACDFRIARLKRCRRLWDILKDDFNLPAALNDFSSGFTFDWMPGSPHQNAISEQGAKATVVYMGEDVNIDQVDAVKKTLEELLHRASCDPDKSIEARQRLAVWYRNDDSDIVVHKAHAHMQIDMTGDRSALDIGRVE